MSRMGSECLSLPAIADASTLSRLAAFAFHDLANTTPPMENRQSKRWIGYLFNPPRCGHRGMLFHRADLRSVGFEPVCLLLRTSKVWSTSRRRSAFSSQSVFRGTSRHLGSPSPAGRVPQRSDDV